MEDNLERQQEKQQQQQQEPSNPTRNGALQQSLVESLVQQEDSSLLEVAEAAVQNSDVRRSVHTFASNQRGRTGDTRSKGSALDSVPEDTPPSPAPSPNRPSRRRVMTASLVRRLHLYQRFHLKIGRETFSEQEVAGLEDPDGDSSMSTKEKSRHLREGEHKTERMGNTSQPKNTTHSDEKPARSASRDRARRPASTIKRRVVGLKEPHFGQKRQGRLYSKRYSQQPGGLRLHDMIFGVKMAHLSCTDDTPTRLQTSGANTLATLQHIVGSDDFRKPLSTILRDTFNLEMSCWMDETGFFYGRPVDCQGYIAATPTSQPLRTMVLSYRFSTSAMDWMTNLSMTTSEWCPQTSAQLGRAATCSCVAGLHHFGRKPRVHTGYYNNFVYTIPHIRKHIIEPILSANQVYQEQRKEAGDAPDPIKIYVCGASLGAAIATLAYIYILFELPLDDHTFLPVKLISVTAGSPRVCNAKMKQLFHQRMSILRPMDRAVFARLVYNQDLVPHLPFGGGLLRFHHLDKLVFITHDGDIIINPHLVLTREGFSEVRLVIVSFFKDQTGAAMARMPYYTGAAEIAGAGIAGAASAATAATNVVANATGLDIKAAFAKEVESTPGPVRDHMPFWYLTSLENAKAKEDRAFRKPDAQTITNG